MTAISLIFNQVPGNAGWQADTNGNGIPDGEDRDVNLSKRIDRATGIWLPQHGTDSVPDPAPIESVIRDSPS